MKIANVNYDHSEFRSKFQNDIKKSLLYLIECSQFELSIPDNFQLRGNIFGAYYLAVSAAEKDNRELCVNYLNYVVKESSRYEKLSERNTNIVALDYKILSEFDINIILLILNEDDKGIKVGFQKDENISMEKEKVIHALTLLKEYDIGSYKECCEFIDTIYLTGNTKGYYIRSGCSFNLWGLIFLYANERNTVPYYIEHIVHECAHHALNIINADDAIVENSPDERFSAPFRDDARPMIGIFHALFVLCRICQSLKKIINHYNGEYYEELNERLKIAISKYYDTLKIVENHAKLTSVGKQILSDINMSMSGVI
ncbi:aKG-HExxH-type peptide beta-hydroxylase [Xenorhabdus sp. IM139775]|uniref:aKG-HExxH-type peptide beta-hydroxylase n=1 Tax=Xenorhabdus sp. IM139775 TaxID=3025876 RepID=UPI0023594E84|nr:HEXXH motif-containing putative peptide modification protein [Xenorhabdus sp. IM139775]MDC9594070.1 HEXXH motif-containing putative peptide modification protein [Xenorhabdus sp. IM139775]